jgi:hypothetical protein
MTGIMTGKTTRFRPVSVLGLSGLALALLGAACGGGDSKSDAGGTGGPGGPGACTIGTYDSTPVGQCKKFVNVFCCRAQTCDPPDGGTDGGTLASCQSAVEVAVGCDRATSTAFPLCITDTQAVSCSGLGLNPGGAGFQPPASCNDPINSIPLSDAQNKCGVLGQVICDPIDVCANPNNPPSDQSFMDCVNQAYNDVLQCAFATGVSATYNTCLDDICAQAATDADGGAPDAGPSVPASCKGVILGPM